MKMYKNWPDFRGMSDAGMIRTLKQYDEITTITTLGGRGWDDIQFNANRAGMNVVRFIDKGLSEKHLFSECYTFTKK